MTDAIAAKPSLDLSEAAAFLGLHPDTLRERAGYAAAQSGPPREPTETMLDAARIDRIAHGLDQDLRVNIWRAMHDAWAQEQPSGTEAQSAHGEPMTQSRESRPGPLDHQYGGQGHVAIDRCSLGASPLESGNAREATCLSGGRDGRRSTPTQQGQLGANAGSTPAPPTDHQSAATPSVRASGPSQEGAGGSAADPIADLCERLRDEASQYTDHSDLWAESADALERLRAERDTLAAIVRAADGMYAFTDHPGGEPGCNKCAAADDYLAARAKWEDRP